MSAELAQDIHVSEEDRLRADIYNFLGLLLARPADQILLDQCSALSGDQGEFGQPHEWIGAGGESQQSQRC